MIKTIALIRASSTATRQQTQQTADYIKQQYGCRVIYGEDCFKSMSAQQRADKLIAYLADDQIDLLWSIRGGEGSADLIPFLDQHKADIGMYRPKYLLGFSDMTALLVYFYQQFGWPSIHGPTALQLPIKWLNSDAINNLQKWLQTEQYGPIHLTPLNEIAKQPNTIQANCTGGNMSLLNISIGDSWQIDTTNKIVFIEDWHEKGYVIDRTLKYFDRIGLFRQAKALILGDLEAGQFDLDPQKNQQQQDYLQKVLIRFTAALHIPVLQTNQFGHGASNMLIPYQRSATLQTGQIGQLSIS